jgi:hypothetical protein
MLNQTHEAAVFRARHGERIEQCRAQLTAFAKMLIDRCAGTDIAPALAETCSTALKESLWAFFRPFRAAATEFGKSGSLLRSVYWSLVDAIAFLDEAASDVWPYITQERREQYLTWAMEVGPQMLEEAV